MAGFDLLVLNGLVVTDQTTGHFDIAIKDGKISEIVPPGSIPAADANKIIDAQGGMVMPGGVDAHVHIGETIRPLPLIARADVNKGVDEPPLFGKGETADNYETGTRSAIAGGTTTLIAFAPQEKSQPSLLGCLRATEARANGNCYSDYSFHLICSNAGPQAISEFSKLREEGISSLKIYMTYEALQLNDAEILDVLFEARKQKIVTMIHAENGAIIDWTIKKLEEQKLFDPKYHADSHPPVAEIEATYRAISLSGYINVPILIVHVSSPAAAQHIHEAQEKGLPIYAETCPQYLFLTRTDLDKPGFEGAKCVCSPPPRESEQDHEAIWKGLENGTFTVLNSDHCPFRYDDAKTGKKTVISAEYPNGHFKYIPNGCPGVETRLSLILSANRLQLQRFVELTSTNAAKLYGLYPTKGALIPGESDADLTIWYPKDFTDLELINSMLHHNVDYTPYEGRKLKQWPRYTVLRGEIVWDRDNGGVVGKKGYGKFLKRGPSSLAGSSSAGARLHQSGISEGIIQNHVWQI